ncbi:TetR/AcrR family transcriptional regulator [Deinococcus wulumuqiensis]
MPRPPADAPLLNTDLILSHALTLIDANGLDNLSLRGLAERLGVKPNALYHYFANKEQLVEAAYARALAELPLPDPMQGDWREGLSSLAGAFRSWCQRHPHLVPVVLRHKSPLHEEARLTEAVAALLRQAGILNTELSPVTRQLIAFFAGSFVVEWGNDAGSCPAEQEQVFRTYPGRYPVMAGLPPATPGSDHAFSLMTRLLIAGIEGLA